MVESDNSEGENNPTLGQSKNNFGGVKRLREESSDENESINKKTCIKEIQNFSKQISDDKNVQNDDINKIDDKITKQDVKNDNQQNISNIDIDTSTKGKTIDVDTKIDASSNGKEIEDTKEIGKADFIKSTAEKNNDLNMEESSKSKEQAIEDSDKNEQKLKIEKQKRKMTKKDDKEIINGVELTVECASDEESSEQSDTEKDEKPRSKTIIVREKPNDSEVDASSSESEKSNASNLSETKSSSNAIAMKSKKSNILLNKETTPEKSESNSDDENFSLITKKKIKKSPSPKRNAVTEVKRGRGRPRGRPPKTPKSKEKLLSDVENKNEKEIIEEKLDAKIESEKDIKEESDSKTESKKDEALSELSSDDKSDNESIDNNDGKVRKSSQRNIKRMKNLKKYIYAAGIKVKCYQTLLKDCKTDAAKVRYLSEFLKEHGMIGKPTLEKCKKLKMKNETNKEVQELDSSNIISETRLTRGRNTRKSHGEPEVPASPVQKSRASFKKIKSIVDSDSE